MSEPVACVLEARAILRWALQQYPEPGRVAMTSAFGLSGCALIHLVYGELGWEVPVLFVNTGHLFPETLETRDRLRERYGLDLVEIEARGKMPPPGHAQCCQKRKVEPMRALLEKVAPAALLSARGRFQAVTRLDLQLVEWERRPLRVNPLANWAQADVEAYVRDNGVPYNPLYDQGYFSIGCRPCTRAVKAGEDVRAGRWDGLGRVECGLWT